MSEPTRPQDVGDAAGAGETPAKRPPIGIGFAFLLLLMAVFAATQIFFRSGPAIAWKYDLDEALTAAQQQGRRVFLVLHEPGCPITDTHDRGLFTERRVRERLAQMVCCRVELQRGARLARRYRFEGDPLMLVVDAQGRPVSTTLTGPVDYKQLWTHMQP